MDRDLDALRAEPTADNRVGVVEVTDSYAKIVAALPEAPVLVGHSFGGLIVQLLLDRGLGAAGVAISPAPVKGVLRLPIATLRSSAPVLTKPATRHRVVGLTADQWFYAFANTVSRGESDELYARLQVPTPGRPLWQAAFANVNPKAPSKVDSGKADRAPLLILGNDADHTVPASVSREAFTRQRKSGAITAYHEFPGRPHLTASVPGWKEVADLALAWALAPPAPARSEHGSAGQDGEKCTGSADRPRSHGDGRQTSASGETARSVSGSRSSSTSTAARTIVSAIS